MMALLSRSIPAGLFMEPKRAASKEGSMQPSVSQPESGFGKERGYREAGLPSAVGERRVGQKVGKT